MKRTIRNKKFNYVVLSSIIVVVCVILLSIGWSAFQSTFNISGLAAIIRLDRDVRITGARILSTSSSAVSNYEEYNVNDVYTSVSLPNANSTATYEVTVTNIGNSEVGIRNITGLPSNLEYTLENYTLEDVLCDDVNNSKCKLGAVTSILITIGYAENGYSSGTTTYVLDLDFDFMSIEWVARIGVNRYFETLQKAVEAVPTDGTSTTVQLLKNTSEYIEVDDGRNVVFDLQNYTVNSTTIDGTGKPVLEIWNGYVTMTNGTLNCTAGQAAVNIWVGEFNISGGTINTTGTKQALYNTGGTVTISGTATLHNISSSRPAVQNHDPNGTIIITGGTIIADRHAAVQNEAGTLRIGANDGTISTATPVIRGGTYAVNNSNVITISSPPATVVTTSFEWYDGVLYGKTNSIYNDGTSYVTIPTGYGIYYQNENISGATYQKGTLAIVNEVTFDPNQGTVGETLRRVKTGAAIGALPTPQRPGYVFDGWFYSNGTQASASDIVNSDFTLTAEWIDASNSYLAQIGTTKYNTLEEALLDVPANTETTILILHDISLSQMISLASNKEVVIDLKGNKIDTSAGTVFYNEGTLKVTDSASGGEITGGMVSGGVQVTVINNRPGGIVYIQGGTISSNNSQVIDNNGTMHITGGKVTIGSVSQGVINNNAGAILNMSGGEITAPKSGSKRQAIYNKGTVNISGTAVLTSYSSDRATLQNDASGASITISGGTIASLNTNCQRGAVQNGSGTLVITGGTIISKSTNTTNGPSGVQNAGTLRIGTDDGTISSSTPVIQASKYGVYNTGTFNFFDGKLMGIQGAVSGTINNHVGSYVDTTETIGNATYYVKYLN